MDILDLGAAERAARKGTPAAPQGAPVMGTQELPVKYKAPAKEIDGKKHEQAFQISPSMAEFENPIRAIWTKSFLDRGDGAIQLGEGTLPWTYDIGKVNVGDVVVEIPMRADCALIRLYPGPGTAIHCVPYQAWMTIHSGNLKEFENYLAEHPDPRYVDPNLDNRLNVIMKAQMDFHNAQKSEEAGSPDSEGEEPCSEDSPSTENGASTASEGPSGESEDSTVTE